MKTAIYIKTMTGGYNGDARLYELHPPANDVEFVVVSAIDKIADTTIGPETYIFTADVDGEITSWNELPGSFKGGMDHHEALRGLGYEIVE